MGLRVPLHKHEIRAKYDSVVASSLREGTAVWVVTPDGHVHYATITNRFGLGRGAMRPVGFPPAMRHVRGEIFTTLAAAKALAFDRIADARTRLDDQERVIGNMLM
jgi:hypothetical protein